MKLKIAIIGLGSISPMHTISVANQSDAYIAAVCDIKADRAKIAAQKFNAQMFTDYKKMIEETKPDAVHILTPHYLHAPMTKYALERGVHVLCEKPMSIKYEDAVECVRLAEQKKLQYGVIFQSRYNTASKLVKKYLDNGQLGKVISATSTLTWHREDSYYIHSDWKGTWDKEGGGVIIDQAIHSIDLVNWFIGDKPVKVSAHTDNRAHHVMEVEDSAEGLITYKGGTVYGFYAMNNYAFDEPVEIKLFCEKGKVHLSYNDAVVEFNGGGKISVSNYITHQIEYENAKEYWGFMHIDQIRQFYDSILGKQKLEISGGEALKTQKIINAIYKSSNTGNAVELE